MISQEVRASTVPQRVVVKPIVTPVARARVHRIARAIPRFHQLPFFVVTEPVPMPVLHWVHPCIAALLVGHDPVPRITNIENHRLTPFLPPPFLPFRPHSNDPLSSG